MKKIWTCKIGEAEGDRLPDGSDGPMRNAVEAAYRSLTGEDPAFAFTGWHGELTYGERAVVEDREPTKEEWWMDHQTDALINEILKEAPDSWDDDASGYHIALEYVRELERRVVKLGGSLEKFPEE